MSGSGVIHNVARDECTVTHGYAASVTGTAAKEGDKWFCSLCKDLTATERAR